MTIDVHSPVYLLVGYFLRSLNIIACGAGLLLMIYMAGSEWHRYGEKRRLIFLGFFLWFSAGFEGSAENILQHNPIGPRTLIAPLAAILSLRAIALYDLTLLTPEELAMNPTRKNIEPGTIPDLAHGLQDQVRMSDVEQLEPDDPDAIEPTWINNEDV